MITTEFGYGFIEFSPELAVKIPGGLSFNIARYWDGQPVRFVCCERSAAEDAQEPWGRVLWCVSVELDEGETAQELQDDDDID